MKIKCNKKYIRFKLNYKNTKNNLIFMYHQYYFINIEG